MAKIHYQGLPCNSKILVRGDGGLIQSDTKITDEPLPQTHAWGKVTCQKCLRSKPGEKATPKQRIAINHLKKLIKGWPADLELIYDPDNEWIVVLYDGEILANLSVSNRKASI